MASRVELRHRYPEPPERVREVITDNIGKLMDAEYRFTPAWLRDTGA